MFKHTTIAALLALSSVSWAGQYDSEWIDAGPGMKVISSMTEIPPAMVDWVTLGHDGFTNWWGGSWHNINVAHLVPQGTRAIHLNGQLIISHGNQPQDCDMFLSVRAHGEFSLAGRGAQALETIIASGVRQNWSRWVPLHWTPDGQALFQIKVELKNTGSHPNAGYDFSRRPPEWCSFGYNGWIDAVAGAW